MTSDKLAFTASNEKLVYDKRQVCFTAPNDSARLLRLEELRNIGNFEHNKIILNGEIEGDIIVDRKLSRGAALNLKRVTLVFIWQRPLRLLAD